MRWDEIPQFVQDGPHQTDISLKRIASTIKEFEEEYGLVLNPNFQRGHVWTDEQQVSWLEFFLQGGRTSRVIYFNYPTWRRVKRADDGDYNAFVCVDGLQRLTTVIRFLNNEIKAFGKYYSEFEGFLGPIYTLSFNTNELQTEKEVLQWYVQMNSGGTPHTEEEINRVNSMIESLEN